MGCYVVLWLGTNVLEECMYQITWHHIPDDCILNGRRFLELKSSIRKVHSTFQPHMYTCFITFPRSLNACILMYLRYSSKCFIIHLLDASTCSHTALLYGLKITRNMQFKTCSVLFFNY